MKRVMLMAVGALLVALCSGAAFADDSRFVFSEQTVKDKRTALVWTRNASLAKRNWDGAIEFVKELNQIKYAGYNDWRLSSKKDLDTLVTYADGAGYGRKSNPRYIYQLFNQMGFYDVRGNYYWSSSRDGNVIWAVDLSSGNWLESTEKSASLKYWDIWPVRGGK